MDCTNRSGKFKTGQKVTGLLCLKRHFQTPQLTAPKNSNKKSGKATGNENPSALSQLLVTTNDNRIRLCGMEDYSITMKYKGLSNKCMQIKAQVSADQMLLLCGSDTGSIYIWDVMTRDKDHNSFFPFYYDGSKNAAFVSFDVTRHQDIAATVALFAPPHTVTHFVYSNHHILTEEEEHNCLLKRENLVNDSLKSVLNTSLREDMLDVEDIGTKGMEKELIKKTSSFRSTVSNDSTNMQLNSPRFSDTCSRVIITADYDGILKVFFRLE